MKKSKVLAISLGAVALTGFAVATPVIITSCSSNFVDYTIPNNLITLKPGIDEQTYRLERKENTNDFNLYVNKQEWSDKDLEVIDWSNFISAKGTQNIVDRKTLEKLGFDKGAINSEYWINPQTGVTIGFSPGVCDNNGNIVYPFYQDTNINSFAKWDYAKPCIIMDTFKVFQLNITKLWKELKKQGLTEEDLNGPEISDEVRVKLNKAVSNSTEKNYNFNFKFTIHPGNK